jgi:hypothetical protein
MYENLYYGIRIAGGEIMYFIKYDAETESLLVHAMPFHKKYGFGKTKEELEQEGFFVESIPEPQQIEGKAPILRCNPTTKELWYEYEDIPPTPEELQQEQLGILGQQLFQTQTELLETKRENELLGQQLFNLQTILVEEGVM